MDDNGTWFKAHRSSDAYELCLRSESAFCLLWLICARAQRTATFNRYGLKLGESLIGDRRGMTEKVYRTAKKNLQEWGFASFKGTPRGTIATLLNVTVFDPNIANAMQETLQKRADEGRTEGGPKVAQRADQEANQRADSTNTVTPPPPTTSTSSASEGGEQKGEQKGEQRADSLEVKLPKKGGQRATTKKAKKTKNPEQSKDVPPVGGASGAEESGTPGQRLRQAELVASWCECFRQQFGAEYSIAGGRDWKAAWELTATREPGEVMKVATRAWTILNGFLGQKAATIHGLLEKLNEIQVALVTEGQPKRGPLYIPPSNEPSGDITYLLDPKKETDGN
jgi:hypothetical protein